MLGFSHFTHATVIPRLADDTAGSSRLSLKVFPNPSGDMWKANVKDIQGEILCVSQFTLMANTSKGSKPDFHRAMVRIFPSSLATVTPSFTCEKVGRSITGHVRLISTIHGNPILSREDQG